MKKSILLGLLIAALFHMGAREVGAQTIRMGYFEIKPHIYTSKTPGRPSGALVKYLEIVVKKMGYDLIWVGPLPHTRLILYLEEGRVIDGDPLISMTPERAEFLYYPENHFYLAKPNFVVKISNPLQKIDSVDDVRGYVIGQFKKAANSRFVIDNQSAFKFDIISTGKHLFEQHLKRLAGGRVDAIHTLDEFSLLYEAKRLKMDDQIKVLFLPEPPLPFYTVFCKSERGQRLTEQYDNAIQDLGLTPEYYAMLIQREFDLLDRNKRIQASD